MRFIKRFIFVVLLLVIVFFIYRLINPTAAKALLFDLKTFSNDKIGTHFSLSGEVITSTGVELDLTGTVLDITGGLQELTGDEELLLNDMVLSDETFTETGASVPSSDIKETPCPAMSTVNSCPTGQEKYVTYSSSACGTYYACKKKPTTTTSSNGLSAQDKRDAANLLGGFGN
ncbi:MAG: hypothetical protein WC010_00335 [Candidatus Absconditabacterales bacterium]